jgi:hypothetical protein
MRDKYWRQKEIDYLKWRISRWDEEPIDDGTLSMALKFIKVLESNIQDYDFWNDYPKGDIPLDRKNWRYGCTCDEGNIGNHTYDIRERLPYLKIHRHRIYRTLEQAIKELDE